MIKQTELKVIRDFAENTLIYEGRPFLADLIIILLDEFEKINAINSVITEVSVKKVDGEVKIIWPVKELEGGTI